MPTRNQTATQLRSLCRGGCAHLPDPRAPGFATLWQKSGPMSCLEHFSMAQSNTEEHQRFSQSELDNVSRGSILKVSDPDKGVWYWVIIERRLDNHHFIGRIDADCLIRPSLRHGGRIAFHQDHILYIWRRKVDQVFDSAWFRLLSHILSFGTVTKVLKRSTPGSNSVRLEMRFTRHIK
jgi:hypothetical protein